MNTTIIDALAGFACDTTYDDLPEDVITTSKHVLLDSVGCAIGGVNTDPGKMAISIASQLGGPEECVVWGTGQRVSVANAVFANGQLVNALDFDTVMPGGHTPPYIVPTVLSMAEREGASGKDLVTATAVALEIAARVSAATPRAMSFDEEGNFRYAKREGYARLNFGAAAGAGRFRGLDRWQTVNAMSLAGHMSQLNTWSRANYSMPRNMTKYGFPGWQNTGAIMAVLYAEQGLWGDVEILDDDEHGYGEFSGYDGWDPSRITAGIGSDWSIAETVRFKPYACCTMLHRGLEAFEDILRGERLHRDEIEKVTVEASPTVTSSLFTDRSMNNIVDFQFGMHYILSMVAHGERTGADWQDWNKLTDPGVREFADRVETLPNPDFENGEVSRVTVHARDTTFVKELSGYTLPLTHEELVAKYRNNAARPLIQAKVDESLDAFVNLEQLGDVRTLTAALSI